MRPRVYEVTKQSGEAVDTLQARGTHGEHEVGGGRRVRANWLRSSTSTEPESASPLRSPAHIGDDQREVCRKLIDRGLSSPGVV